MKKTIVLTLIMLAGMFLIAQEKEEKPWKDSMDFSLVGTGGNSESLTLGFKNEFSLKQDKTEFIIKMGAIRSESTRFTYWATGSEENYDLIKNSNTEKTDEKYFINTKYNHEINKKTFWFLGLDWDRNEFAGIANRYAGGIGFGNKWIDTKHKKFSTSYGLQYTQENLVYEPEGYDNSYGSVKLSYNFLKDVGQNSSFKQDFDLIANIEESGDFRADLKSNFTTTLSKRLALKVGLQLAYDNQPAFKLIDLRENDQAIGQVPYELDELDYIFTTSLVINL